MIINSANHPLSMSQRIAKRLFDIIFSLLLLLTLLPLLILIWILLSVFMRENGFFFQQRVGRGGQLFNIIKFKTMKNISGYESTITSLDDIRITKIGYFFRQTKIDELPQLWNVLIGQMSFVGPRPDVPDYADKLSGSDRMILLVRPGITGPAQIFYSNEGEILSKQKNIKKYNDSVIWPNKVRINLKYVNNQTFWGDVRYIWRTIV
jgi:lipopolysaccharide/colanic/teichoic acid biosynthesis glycosyltransferase